MPYSGRLQVAHRSKKFQEYMKKQREKNREVPNPVVSPMYNNAGAQVYSGGTRRIDRYRFFDIMETDSTIDTALNILTDLITQNNDNDELPLKINYIEEVSDKEVELLENSLRMWLKLNELDVKMYDYVRDTLKYGDTFYIRDPETQELIYVDPYNVEAVIVDEQEGKVPQIYRIKDVDINLVNKSIVTSSAKLASPYGNMGLTPTYSMMGTTGGIKENGQLSRGALDVDAKHVIHISLNTKGGILWPFGDSVLTKAFKTYKQKELLEDASIIFRLQRATDRRVFKINVGNMPTHKAQQYIERFKNEMIQRRVPSKNFLESGVYNVSDNIYNPMSITDDIYLPVNEDGKGSDVSVLQGQTNWDILPEIQFFDNALIRAMGLPQNYFSTQGEESNKTYNAGRLGEMLQIEMRTAKMIRRYQKIIANSFDKEFKQFCKNIGVEIDESIFNLTFCDNMNFGKWIELEIQANYISQFKDLADFSYMSKEFILKKYLNWTEADIEENKRLWMIENQDKLKNSSIETVSKSDLSVGLSAVGIPKVTEDIVMSKGEDHGGGSGGSLGGGGDFGGDLGGDLGDIGGGEPDLGGGDEFDFGLGGEETETESEPESEEENEES